MTLLASPATDPSFYRVASSESVITRGQVSLLLSSLREATISETIIQWGIGRNCFIMVFDDFTESCLKGLEVYLRIFENGE